MKATGIVRRIDDLGRVVIPKEIRRTIGVREGDPLEIFLSGKNLVLKKYSEFSVRKELTDQLLNGINTNKFKGINIAIVDTDTVMSVKTSSQTRDRELENTTLSNDLIDLVTQPEYPVKNTVVDIPGENKMCLTNFVPNYSRIYVRRVYRVSPHVGAIVIFGTCEADFSIPEELDTIMKYLVSVLKSEEY